MDRATLKRRCQSNCQQHVFCLKKQGQQSRQDISLSFCPKFNRNRECQSTYPQYNRDNKYYTSGFMLGVDIRELDRYQGQQYKQHQQQINQVKQKDIKIVFPKPNKKHTLCSACKDYYDNYRKHIILDTHITKIKDNKFNSYIDDLCHSFQSLWKGKQQVADQWAISEMQQRPEKEWYKKPNHKKEHEQLQVLQQQEKKIIQQDDLDNQRQNMELQQFIIKQKLKRLYEQQAQEKQKKKAKKQKKYIKNDKNKQILNDRNKQTQNGRHKLTQIDRHKQDKNKIIQQEHTNLYLQAITQNKSSSNSVPLQKFVHIQGQVIKKPKIVIKKIDFDQENIQKKLNQLNKNGQKLDKIYLEDYLKQKKVDKKRNKQQKNIVQIISSDGSSSDSSTNSSDSSKSSNSSSNSSSKSKKQGSSDSSSDSSDSESSTDSIQSLDQKLKRKLRQLKKKKQFKKYKKLQKKRKLLKRQKQRKRRKLKNKKNKKDKKHKHDKQKENKQDKQKDKQLEKTKKIVKNRNKKIIQGKQTTKKQTESEKRQLQKKTNKLLKLIEQKNVITQKQGQKKQQKPSQSLNKQKPTKIPVIQNSLNKSKTTVTNQGTKNKPSQSNQVNHINNKTFNTILKGKTNNKVIIDLDADQEQTQKTIDWKHALGVVGSLAEHVQQHNQIILPNVEQTPNLIISTNTQENTQNNRIVEETYNSIISLSMLYENNGLTQENDATSKATDQQKQQINHISIQNKDFQKIIQTDKQTIQKPHPKPTQGEQFLIQSVASGNIQSVQSHEQNENLNKSLSEENSFDKCDAQLPTMSNSLEKRQYQDFMMLQKQKKFLQKTSPIRNTPILENIIQAQEQQMKKKIITNQRQVKTIILSQVVQQNNIQSNIVNSNVIQSNLDQTKSQNSSNSNKSSVSSNKSIDIKLSVFKKTKTIQSSIIVLEQSQQDSLVQNKKDEQNNGTIVVKEYKTAIVQKQKSTTQRIQQLMAITKQKKELKINKDFSQSNQSAKVKSVKNILTHQKLTKSNNFLQKLHEQYNMMLEKYYPNTDSHLNKLLK